MRQIALTQVRAGTDAGKAHLLHVPLNRFAIDDHSFPTQLHSNPSRTVERIVWIERINAMFECHLLSGSRYGLVIKTRTTETQEFGLYAKWRVPIGRVLVAFHQHQAFTSTQG